MAVPRQRRARAAKRRRERLAVFAMALFPLLVGVGFLTPGWVRVFATAQELDDPPRGPLVDRVGPFARRPLPAPREFFGGAAPELLDLDQLFAGEGAAIAPDATGRTGSFARTHSDSIVMDDLGKQDPDVDFKDLLIDDTRAIAKLSDDDEGVLPVCGTLPFGNCVRYDDFTGASLKLDSTPVPVPEPGTAALLALGLGWLGRRRRARS